MTTQTENATLRYIRTFSNFIDLIQFHRFNVSNVGEIFWVEPEKTVS